MARILIYRSVFTYFPQEFNEDTGSLLLYETYLPSPWLNEYFKSHTPELVTQSNSQVLRPR
jgi:hypothetical protein